MVKFLFGNRTFRLSGLVAFLCFLFLVKSAEAQRTASASGSWTNTATWGGASVPTSADAVTINSGITVTVDAPGAQCASIAFVTAAANNGLIMNSGTSLNVTGNITLPRPSTGFNTSVDVDAGNLVVGGNIALAGTSGSGGTRLTKITLSTGTISVTGNITSAGIESQVIFSGAGIVNVGGSFLSSAAKGTLTPSSGTVNYNGAAQTITAFTYNHLNLSGSGAKTHATGTTVGGNLNLSGSATMLTTAAIAVTGSVTLSGTSNMTNSTGALTVGGDLLINSGSTFQANVTGLNIAGVTSVNGTLQINAGATKTFTGLITIYNGGVLQMMAGSPSPTTASYSYQPGSTLLYSGATAKTAGSECPATIPDDVTLKISNTGGVTLGTKTIGGGTSGVLEIVDDGLVSATSTITYDYGSTLLYSGTAANTSTNIEWSSPANVIINNTGGVTLGAAKSLSGVITFSNGILTTTATNSLSITNTDVTAIVGGSTSSYISGPLSWNLPTISTSGSTYVFPIGKGACGYLPLEVKDPFTTRDITLKVEAFCASAGGTRDATLVSSSTTEYWSFVAPAITQFQNASFSLTKAAGRTHNVIGMSTTKTGVYTSICGTISGNSIINSNTITGPTRFFIMATDINPVTSVSATQSAADALTVSWTAASGYNSGSQTTLVFVKPTSAVTQGVPSNDPSSYTAASAIGSGTAYENDANAYCVYKGDGTSATVTGLTQGVTYHVLVYTVYDALTCSRYEYSSSAVSSKLIHVPVKYYVNNTSLTGDIYCTAVGSSTNNGLSPSTPLNSLSTVLSNYSASISYGDSIFVDAGTYSDVNLSSPNEGAVIIGAGYAKTNFNNSGTNYFMRINDNNTVLSSMSISNFNETSGTGQTLGIESNVTGVKIINTVIYYETGSNFAAGYPIQVQSGAEVSFSGGGAACTKGGGTSAGGGIGVNSATVSVENYLFYANEQSFQHGGAMNISGGNVTVRNTAFKYNKLASDKLGSAMYVTAGTVNVYDSDFSDNSTGLSADIPGGSILITGGAVRITRSKIMNHTQTGSSRSKGAGIAVTGGTVTIDSCYFSGNIGKTSVATDVYVEGGVTLARYNTFASSSFQIGRGAGTFTIEYSGNPSSNGTITKTNTITTTYTPSPSVPTYTGSCSSSISSFTILPIELTQFNGDCSDGHVLLTWQTATEKNNKLFTIERSLNGVDFNVIGSVAGSGNSLQLRNYKFVDADDTNGIVYYRLSQEDYDGKQSQSNIISVDKSCQSPAEPEIVLYPNPTQQNVTIDVKLLRSSQVAIEVMDAIGRTVKSIQMKRYDEGIQSIDMNLDEVAKGIYFLNVVVNEQRFTQKFVKL
jgi:hypothetical protein